MCGRSNATPSPPCANNIDHMLGMLRTKYKPRQVHIRSMAEATQLAYKNYRKVDDSLPRALDKVNIAFFVINTYRNGNVTGCGSH